mmetsp:Transcript_42464/g.31106  ORF Transcript_42464/g.31106 Transcript_42464/m.31106 type:complete len:144 (+) Transcript_42464:958-1389(+)
MFRNQIPDAFVAPFVGKVCPFLKSASPVNQSYAAAVVEKLLTRKGADAKPIFTPENMDQNTLLILLTNVCDLLQSSLNLYGMRALFRVVQLAGTSVAGLAQQLSYVLAQFVLQTTKDQANCSPNYTYILFETVALSLKNMKGN